MVQNLTVISKGVFFEKKILTMRILISYPLSSILWKCSIWLPLLTGIVRIWIEEPSLLTHSFSSFLKVTTQPIFIPLKLTSKPKPLQRSRLQHRQWKQKGQYQWSASKSECLLKPFSLIYLPCEQHREKMLTICLFTSLLLMSCLITFATVDFFFAGSTRYLHLSDIFFFKEKKKGNRLYPTTLPRN